MYPTLNLQFARGRFPDPRIVFSRAAAGTYRDALGQVQLAPAGWMRFDYDEDGLCSGLLLEDARTNLLLDSANPYEQPVMVSAQAYTLTFWGGGTVTLSGAHSAVVAGTDANTRTSLTFTPSAGVLTLTPTGSVLRWQLESGDTPSSYIPTTDAPATRGRDSAYVDGTGWLNPAEGTIVVEVQEPPGVTTTTTLLTLSEGASIANRYSLQGSGSTLRMLRVLSGASVATSLGSSAPRGQWNRVAFGYSPAGLTVAANGEVAINSTTLSTPGTPSRLYLGGTHNVTAFSWIREVQYYPVRLSPEDLVRITK